MAGGGGNDQLLNTGLMIAAGMAAPALAPALMSGGALGLGLGATAATGITGAALGGLTGALTGQDVGRSALMGGLGGAASGAFGGVNAAEQGSMLAAGQTAPGAGLSTMPAGSIPTSAGVSGGFQSTTPGVANLGGPGAGGLGQSLNPNSFSAAQLGGQQAAGSMVNAATPSIPSGLIPSAAPNAASSFSSIPANLTPSAAPNASSFLSAPASPEIFGMSKASAIGGGAAGINSLLSTPPVGAYVPPGSTYTGGSLSKFKYDPNSYQPDIVRPPSPLYRAQYAEGGITSLFNRLAGKPDSDGQFKFDPNKYQPYTVTPPDPYRAQYVEGGLAMGGVSNMPPQTNFANPSSYEQGTSQYSMATDPMSGNIANRMASGGIAQLAVGGKLLRGDGDGMSDSINANIAGSQQARLADGEFVIPADVVSHLGNGSTDAGAKHLYSMMDKVRQARVGTKKQGKQINPNKFIPV
jgi:hypothetical protein